jgi:hypothetical protein
MRKELFVAICDALKGIQNEHSIEHVDLWNNNVIFIEEETPFQMPAVFVEFDQISWSDQGDGEFKSKPTVKLHVVSRWEGSAADGSEYRGDALDVFDLLEDILFALTDLSGESFHKLQRIGSITNHDHEEIIENIEVYQCIAFDNYVRKKKLFGN